MIPTAPTKGEPMRETVPTDRPPMWVRCPACHKASGVLDMFRATLLRQHYECDDCGHAWTVNEVLTVTSAASQTANAPRLQRLKN